MPIGQAGHGHIDNHAVDRMEPLQGARGGRQEVERQRFTAMLEVLEVERRGVGARRNEGVGIEGEGADHRGPDTGQFAIPGNVADGVGKLGNGRMHPVGRMACPEHRFETVAEGAVLLREEVPDGGERGQHRRVAHMQDGGREEHRRQLAEVQARAGFLHHLIGRGETLGNGEGIPMFGELLQADRREHIDARQRPAIGRKRLNAPILLPSVVRQVVVFPALGIEDERTVAPACGQRRLNVEHALACPCRRAEKDMLGAIVVERLVLHDAHHYALPARQPTAFDLPIRGPPCGAMHILVAPMPPGEDPEAETEEESPTHRAPDHLGMLLAPLAERHEPLKRRHSRGLRAVKKVRQGRRAAPQQTTMARLSVSVSAWWACAHWPTDTRNCQYQGMLTPPSETTATGGVCAGRWALAPPSPWSSAPYSRGRRARRATPGRVAHRSL